MAPMVNITISFKLCEVDGVDFLDVLTAVERVGMRVTSVVSVSRVMSPLPSCPMFSGSDPIFMWLFLLCLCMSVAPGLDGHDQSPSKRATSPQTHSRSSIPLLAPALIVGIVVCFGTSTYNIIYIYIGILRA